MSTKELWHPTILYRTI